MNDFLKERSTELEIMDDFNCNGEVVDQTLSELHHINTYLGGNQLSLRSIQKLTQKRSKGKYHIVDLGCGGGDTLKLMAQWGERENLDLQLTGIDANPYIVEYAQNNCKQYNQINCMTQNIFDSGFSAQKFDIAHASLFLHHFNQEQIVALFRQLMNQVTIGVVINDLHRHWLSYWFTRNLITRWSKSDMVKYDSVLSVARSFVRADLEKYLFLAGINRYSLKWKWAFRWELIIWK